MFSGLIIIIKKIDLRDSGMNCTMASLYLNGVSDDLSSSINLGTPKVNASGGKNIPVFNKFARSGLKISTPMMLTWGINENDFDNSGKKTYDMSIQFPSPEYATQDTSSFLENLKRLETYIKEQACINSKAWFGKIQSAEVVDAFWTPLLRYPKDKNTGEQDYSKSPSLRVKIPFWDGKFNVEIFNIQGEMVFPKPDVVIMDVVPKSSDVKLILQCGGIWFAGGKFGITWKPFQMVVKPKIQLAQGVCHLLDKLEVQEIQSEAPNSEIQVESDDDIDKEYKPVESDDIPVKGKKKVKKVSPS